MPAQLAVDFDHLKDLYNNIEPFIWYAVALCCWPALRPLAGPKLRATLIMLLIAFGTSDFYESQAWWTPWWLLAWKGLTLSGLVAVGSILVRRSRRGRESIGTVE